MRVSGLLLQFEFTDDYEMMHIAWISIKEAPYCFFKVICQIWRDTGQNNCRFWPELSVSGLWLKFEFIDGFEMMHKAWHCMEEVPYYSSRSSIKFQGHTGHKNDDFDPNKAFSDYNSSLNSPMDVKWCTKLDVL